MPKMLEMKLKKEARKKGFGKKRTGAYVYGTMRNVANWKSNVLGKTRGIRGS